MSTPQKDQQFYNLVKRLPAQLDRARARVRQLEQTARRLGLHDLSDMTDGGRMQG